MRYSIKTLKKVGNFKIKKERKHSKVEQKEKFSWKFNLLIQILQKKIPFMWIFSEWIELLIPEEGKERERERREGREALREHQEEV